MQYSKEDLVKTLKTNKLPLKKGLFKKLFSLAGLEYKGMKYSDGYKDNKSRVVLWFEYNDITENHLNIMKRYVPSIKLKKLYDDEIVVTYIRNEINWKEIDEHTKQFSGS